ncbi:MAG: hypothetical protein LAN61_06440 [Acidobacteriia bacterium]|nr:hypothetical protein [Terriglobia bacterium]
MKHPHSYRALVFVGTVLAVLLALFVHYTSAQTYNREGDAWLSMNSDTRLGFVWGYTIGLSRGFAQGCEAYYEVAPPQEPHSFQDDLFGKCATRGVGFSKPVAYYEKQITDFYTSFPAERKVPFEDVLKKLSDSENMTPQQMHEWFKEHGYKK